MGIRSKAVHFVSDITTVLLNPLSDKPSSPDSPLSSVSENPTKYESGKVESVSDEDSEASRDGPDTSSFTAFLYSLLSASDSGTKSDSEEMNHETEDLVEPSEIPVLTDSGRKKSLFSRGKQSLGRAITHAARLGNFRSQSSSKGSSDDIVENGKNVTDNVEETTSVKHSNETVVPEELPEASEPSLLLSEKARSSLYSVLPVLLQGRKWVLLYSTWRHGISLSTLYRRSLLWPGLSLLVVGDRKGAVFGGLVEAPLKSTNKRRYQGNNESFVFTNLSGDPAIFRPTGVNRYFTLCSNEYIALGGGGHFALYLEENLLLGSSSASETYGNPCLAKSENFEVKEVELWGFVYTSKYEEMISILRTEAPGISRW